MSAYRIIGDKDLAPEDQAIVEIFHSKSSWIWTREVGGAAQPPGGEQRAFRKTYINTIPDNPPVNATVVIAVDNYFAMYVNGALLQEPNSGNDLYTAQAYNVPVFGDKVVLAIRAINGDETTPNPAGVKAALKITFQDGRPLTFYTGMDSTWLGERNFGEGWEKPDFNDEKWKPAFVEVGQPYDAIWGPVKKPSRAIVATIDPPSQGPLACNASAPAAIEAGASLGSKAVAFPPGQFAGLVVGIVALSAVLAGIVTFHFTRRNYRRNGKITGASFPAGGVIY